MIWAQSQRLILREWEPRDIAPYAAMTADPVVMRYFPAPLSALEAEDRVSQMQSAWARNGFSFAAVERKADGAFIGMVGLHRPNFEPAGAPVVEVGWSVARPHWRQGYAREAALAALAIGFEDLGLAEIVAFTVPENTASRNVMLALGMEHDPARDFDHPGLPPDHPLRPHVLYALQAQDFAT